jgi:hypothetical protein
MEPDSERVRTIQATARRVFDEVAGPGGCRLLMALHDVLGQLEAAGEAGLPLEAALDTPTRKAALCVLDAGERLEGAAPGRIRLRAVATVPRAREVAN